MMAKPTFLLTDEEGDKVFEKTHGENPHWEYDSLGIFNAMAKAQLKKVVEIIQKNSHNFMLCGNYVDYGEMVVGADAWSQLKEEAGV